MHLLRMLLIVESQTSHGLHLVQSKWCQKKTNIFDLVRNIIFSENFASNYLGLLCFPNICHTMGKNCISIVGSSVLSKEPDKSLKDMLTTYLDISWT
jgi:hypothetical protein